MKIRLLAVCAGAFAVWAPSARSELREDDEQQRAIEHAISDFEAKRFETALEKLLEAQKRVPASASTLNLLGAIYTKKKDFKAAKVFLKGLSRRTRITSPLPLTSANSFFCSINTSRHWTLFPGCWDDPGNEILQFKTALCLLLLARMKFPGNGPAWHYAHAASQSMEVNRREARGLLATAQGIFPGKTSLYDETFQDLSWPIR